MSSDFPTAHVVIDYALVFAFLVWLVWYLYPEAVESRDECKGVLLSENLTTRGCNIVACEYWRHFLNRKDINCESLYPGKDFFKPK